MKINFNNREIEFKFKFRADMLFEDKRGKSFEAKSITDWVTYFWCYYIALTKDHSLTLEEFEDLLDEQPSLLYDFINWYTEYWASNMQFTSKNDENNSSTGELKN